MSSVTTRTTRGKRGTRSKSRSHPYDMGNINNWYSEQFRAKLAEWNIVAPANYTKAELKSLYVSNLSSHSDPNQISQGDSVVAITQESTNVIQDQINSVRTVASSIQESSPTVTSVPGNSPISSNIPQTQTLSTEVPASQTSLPTNVMVNMMSTMTSLMQKVLDKDSGKEEKGRKTLDKFSMDLSTGNNTSYISVESLNTSSNNNNNNNNNCNSTFGLHPEQIKDNDYVSESLREKIVNGKYVNMVLLLIPEFEQHKDKKDRYRDARLNRSLSIDEFIVAFEKYKRIHCTSHPWRKAELDQYESNIIELSRVYGRKFYEYHKIFSQKCAVALEQGKKVNWAEKDKDLLQMIIGGTQCNTCNICKEVSHTTQYCPQNFSQYGVNRYQNSLSYSTRSDNSKAAQSKTALCSFFNGQGCKKDNCTYLHACKRCNSISHGQRYCTTQQIPTLGKSVQQKVQPTKKN